MDGWGIDGEEYIAAVRAGAIDPHGRSAAELQEELDAFDREWGQRLAALSDDELDAVVEGRMDVPPLPGPVESEGRARQREESRFTGRMRALEAQRSRIEAEQRELLAAQLQRLRDRGGDIGMAVKESASTLAAELRLSDRAMERRLTDAFSTVIDLPAAHASHKAGRITGTHLRAIQQATEALRLDLGVDPAERAQVEAELVAIAERTTPSRLRSMAKRIVDRALTAPLQQRHQAAREQRSVWGVDAGDGMMDIGARVPAANGAAILDRLAQAARGKPKDDPRTWDQFRADAFCEMLLAGQVPDDLHGLNPIQATITVTIPATELLDDTDDDAEPRLRFPGSLEGRILVDPATIRSLAAEATTWERLFLDPVTGMPVTVDAYRPSRAQRRWLRARDGRCRWPGCSSPVSSADADHTIDHADGGPTSIENLAHLCRRHHTMKHATAWTVRQLDYGILEWTSPTGQVIIDEPEPPGPAFVDRPAIDRPAIDWGTGDEHWRCTATDPPWAHRRDCTEHRSDATA